MKVLAEDRDPCYCSSFATACLDDQELPRSMVWVGWWPAACVGFPSFPSGLKLPALDSRDQAPRDSPWGAPLVLGKLEKPLMWGWAGYFTDHSFLQGSQLPKPRMLRESGHGDAHLQEYAGNFQGIRFHYDR